MQCSLAVEVATPARCSMALDVAAVLVLVLVVG